jgi:hypothetical protein
MVKSRVNLTLEFEPTGDTPRLRAQEIADRIATFVAATMDTAGTTAQVQSAFLDYKVPYEAERAAFEAQRQDGLN